MSTEVQLPFRDAKEDSCQSEKWIKQSQSSSVYDIFQKWRAQRIIQSKRVLEARLDRKHYLFYQRRMSIKLIMLGRDNEKIRHIPLPEEDPRWYLNSMHVCI